MNLLRYRKRVKDLVLPNGKRVKVEVSDDSLRQHVHDPEDRVHATARPLAIKGFGRQGGKTRRMVLREDGRFTAGSHRFMKDEDMGLWTPLPADVTKEI